MTTAKEGRANKIAQLLENFNPSYVDVPEYIGSAIADCMASFSQNDSQKSGNNVIARKVAEQVDKPFLRFVNEHILTEPKWKLSELAILDFGEADLKLFKWYKPRLRAIENMVPKKYGPAVATIDLLRKFLYRCSIQLPAVVHVLNLEEGQLIPGTTNKFRRKEIEVPGKETRLMERLPWYLQVFYQPDYCEVCCDFNQAKTKLIEILSTKPELSDKVKRLVKCHSPLVAKDYSLQYCTNHKERAACGTANKRRLHFYTAMRLITDVGVITESTPHTHENLRKYAYWLAYQPGRQSQTLKQLPEIVSDLYVRNIKMTGSHTEEELNQLNNLVQILRTLEEESTNNPNWTNKCLGNLKPICTHNLTTEEWRKLVEIEAMKLKQEFDVEIKLGWEAT
ncbi:hypothetical protein AAKU67_004137 [Oxalobacteraceae bacterium GrIS 2.11]